MRFMVYWERFRNLPGHESLYYFYGKMIAVFGLGILVVNWFDLGDFFGWIFLVIGIALALQPGIKILGGHSGQAAKSTKKRRK